MKYEFIPDDAAIIAMDGKDALRFWRQHGAYLLSLRNTTQGE